MILKIVYFWRINFVCIDSLRFSNRKMVIREFFVFWTRTFLEQKMELEVQENVL